MNIKDTIKASIIAVAAAGLFGCASTQSTSGGASTAPAASGGEMVKCAGINACQGKGQCGGAGHACAGKNACKGKGWVKVSKADCSSKGGKAM